MSKIYANRSVTLEQVTANRSAWESLSGIESYHSSHYSTPVFHGATPDGWALTFGFELEVESKEYRGRADRDDDARKIRSVMGDVLRNIEDDGSLNYGFENISNPCSLQFLMGKSAKLADLVGLLNDMGYSSHDAPHSGLHVHVGRKQLGNSEDARDLAIAKIMYLLEHFYATGDMQKFDRRDGNYHYCKRARYGMKRDDKKADFVQKSKTWKNNHCYHDDRYYMLNLTNTDTIEFRMFKGTLSLQTLAASLQFVDAIVRFAMTHTLQQVQSATFADIVGMCKYDELREYCTRRGISL